MQRNITAKRPGFSGLYFIVGQMLDEIAEHYSENISLKTLAEKFGYEYHYLSRLLNKG